jgi:hypothetical protein
MSLVSVDDVSKAQHYIKFIKAKCDLGATLIG